MCVEGDFSQIQSHMHDIIPGYQFTCSCIASIYSNNKWWQYIIADIIINMFVYCNYYVCIVYALWHTLLCQHIATVNYNTKWSLQVIKNTAKNRRKWRLHYIVYCTFLFKLILHSYIHSLLIIQVSLLSIHINRFHCIAKIHVCLMSNWCLFYALKF